MIASGDGLTPALVGKLFNETGCDGVAVARGALGNPWIFRETAEYLKNGEAPPGPDIYEIAQIMKKHLALNTAFHGERIGILLFRKLFAWYVRGISVKQLRSRAFRSCSYDDMLRLICELQLLQDKCHVPAPP